MKKVKKWKLGSVAVIPAIALASALSGCGDTGTDHHHQQDQMHTPEAEHMEHSGEGRNVRQATDDEMGMTEYCDVMDMEFTVDENSRVIEYDNGTKSYVCCPSCI